MAPLAVGVAWLAVVWAQGVQKYQDHKSQLYKDFEVTGALDAALSRIDSQQFDPALVAVLNKALEMRQAALAAGTAVPDWQAILSADESQQARSRLAEATVAREKVVLQYRHLESVARRAQESALFHMACVMLAVTSFLWLNDAWRTIAGTAFTVLAVVALVVHGVCVFLFGRKREEFQRCLTQRDGPAASA